MFKVYQGRHSIFLRRPDENKMDSNTEKQGRSQAFQNFMFQCYLEENRSNS